MTSEHALGGHRGCRLMHPACTDEAHREGLMATRPAQLHDARAHFPMVLVLHDIPNACLAVDGHVIAERAPIVRARGAA